MRGLWKTVFVGLAVLFGSVDVLCAQEPLIVELPTATDAILQRLEALEQTQYSEPVPAAPQYQASRHGFYASIGLRYLQPRTNHFPVSIAGIPNERVYTFDYDIEPSPYVELEWVFQNGFGIRGSYWYYQSEGKAEPDVLGDPLFGVVLRNNTFDVEFTQDIDFDFLHLIYGCGLRYSGMTRNTRNPNIFVRSSRFDGTGPTIMYEVRRRFGAVNLFHSGTTGILFGDERFVATQEGGRLRSDTHETFSAFGDIEVGLEFPEMFKSNFTGRLTCYTTILRDTAYMGLHCQLTCRVLPDFRRGSVLEMALNP